MKLLHSYGKGFNQTFSNKKIVTTIYAILLLFALAIAIPFSKTIKIEAGNSMAISKLLNDFNYTVYTDFMREAGKAIQPYISTAFWIAILYLVFTIFFSGGILTLLKDGKGDKSLKLFWQGCAIYFWRFFRLALYMVILQIIAFIAVYIPLSAIIGSISKTSTEPTIFYTAIAGVVIHLLLFIILLTVTDYAKVMMVEHDAYRPLRTIIRSFGFVFKHFFSTIGLYKSLLIFPVVLFVLYFIVVDKIGMSTWFTIFITFIIQQAFIWLRVYVKFWYLASELDLYNRFDNQDVPVFEEEPALEN
jgi:hypothetical protein